MQSAGDVKLGKSNEKISDVGCVLTAYTRKNKYDHTMSLDKDAYTMSENCGENIRVNDTSGVRTQLVDDPSGRKNKFIRMDFFKINQKQNSSQE